MSPGLPNAAPIGTSPGGPPIPEVAVAVVIGLGGLGCPAVAGLLGAGIRRLVLVDDDRVDVSNLQRQVLFREAARGHAKVDAATNFVAARVPEMEVRKVATTISPNTCKTQLAALVGDCAGPVVVLECTDAPAVKFAVNDACLTLDVPAVIGGVVGWRGRVLTVRRGHACYRCYFEAPPPVGLAPSCDAVGVMGAVAGLTGNLMAAHAAAALSSAAGRARDRAGVLDAVDLRAVAPRSLAAPPRADCPACARYTPATASASRAASPASHGAPDPGHGHGHGGHA